MITLLGGVHFGPQYWLFMKNEVRSRQGITVAPGLLFLACLLLSHMSNLCVWNMEFVPPGGRVRERAGEEFIILLKYSIS